MEVALQDLKIGLVAGELTSVALVGAYIDRIKKYDPVLRSVIELNPDALKEAELCDQIRNESLPIWVYYMEFLF